MALTNLTRVQLEIKGTEAAKVAATDQQVMNYIRAVNTRINNFGYQFEPFYQTKKITPSRLNVNSGLGLLSLNDYLLEVDSITVGGTAYTYGTDIIPAPDNGTTPVKTLQIANLYSGPLFSWYPCCAVQLLNSIVITAFWGMRRYYTASGFFASGATAPALNATQSSFVLATGSISDVDIYGRAPMLSPGNLIRIGDELMEVVKTDALTETLTVLRGWRGTTAATHAAGASIQIWEPEEDISAVATRQVGLLYAKRGAFQAVTSYPDGINITYPSDLLNELRGAIQAYNYV